jgi:feruloyl esterase
MPLCQFPEMARYSGNGDVKDMANWSCPAGDRRMLQIGDSGRHAGVINYNAIPDISTCKRRYPTD